MVGRRYYQPLAFVLFKKLQEGGQHAPYLADVVSLGSSRANGVEFVEEIDAARRVHRIEYQPKLGGRLAEELGNQPVEHRGKQRKAQFSSKGRCGHGLARPGRPDEQKLPPRVQVMIT